ncbi:MAG: hypothetical protein PHH36_06580 [Sideroxydans sp.]|nr:hypothetical protein [Sideroxydans sp.]
MSARATQFAVMAGMLLWSALAQAEYCLDWSAVVRKYSGSSGHCWASEKECNSYRMSRPAGDYSGGCYYKPGMYPRTGQEKGKAKPSEDKAAAELQKKQQAAKQKQAEQERQQAASDRQQLLGTLKGVGPVTPERTILLKPAPPVGGTARSQLDCASRNTALRPEETRDSWENRAKDCSPVTPAVPDASPPVAVDEATPASADQLTSLLQELLQQITATRGLLNERESAVVQAEREVERESAKKSDKPAGESDALRRAKAALAKAKADREKTANELAALEKQEAAARQRAGAQQ